MSKIAQTIVKTVMEEMASRIASCTDFSEKEILEMCMGQTAEQKVKKTKTKKTKDLIVSLPEDSEKTDDDEPIPEETVVPNDPFGLSSSSISVKSEELVKKSTKVKSSLVEKKEKHAIAETPDEMTPEQKETICLKILKTGINKGKCCGKKRKKDSDWCAKHTPKEL